MRASRRPFLLALAVTLIGVLGLSAAVADGHYVRYRDRVTIGRAPDLHGSVISSRAGCEKRRLVRIYRVDPGPDGLLASTRTSSTGRWQYLSPSLNGDFYARIGVRVVRYRGHRHVCGSSTARPVRVGP
jgi:hypothetical protein